MAQYTENYNLELQQGTDFIDVNGLNRNFNTIDTEIKNLEEVKAPKDHKHKTSDITDFPTSLPADGGNADTLGGKPFSDFRLAEVPIATNKDYNTFQNGTTYYATSGCGNKPDDYCIVKTDIAPNGDGCQKAFCLTTRITYNRRRTDTGEWTTWSDDRDGGNAYTVGGKTEAQLIKYDDLFTYTDGRIIHDVLAIDQNNFNDSMRMTYGVVPGTPNSPPGVSYGVRLPCIAYDRNGVLVTVVQLDPVENQGKVWTNLYRKHLDQWTGWSEGNFAQYTSGNELHVKKLGGENGARVSLQRGDTMSTLQGDVKVDTYRDFFRVWAEMNSQAKGFQINLQDIPNGALISLATYTCGTTDITAGSTNIGKGIFHVVYE